MNDDIPPGADDRAERGRRAVAAAQAQIAITRRRPNAFGEDARLFGDPAWMLLLQLYVAAGKDEALATTSACYASGAAATTALRYLVALENRGLVRRSDNPLDKRGSLVVLTPRARALLETVLAT